MAETINLGGKNTITRIDSVLMAVSVDPNDQTEGVCSVLVPGLGWVPLLAADEKREPFVRAQASIVARQTGMTIKLIRLSTRTEIEVVTPAAPEPPISQVM